MRCLTLSLLLVITPAACGDGFVASATASGGERVIALNGEGVCAIGTITLTLGDVKKKLAAPDDYTIINDESSRPRILLKKLTLRSGDKVEVTGVTTNRGKHVFSLSLRKE
jgi:hypothetical protein